MSPRECWNAFSFPGLELRRAWIIVVVEDKVRDIRILSKEYLGPQR